MDSSFAASDTPQFHRAIERGVEQELAAETYHPNIVENNL
jgi:hypothetical protein